MPFPSPSSAERHPSVERSLVMFRRVLVVAIAAAAFVLPATASAVDWRPPACKPPAKCPIEKPPPDAQPSV